MKRFPSFDPPEYLSWQPYPELISDYRQAWSAHEERTAVVDSLSADQRIDLYRGMLRTRLHDIMLKRWVKQGVISKAWLGTGEEATTIGPVHALNREVDVVAPMIRNAGACCEMGLPVADMLRGYLGSGDSPSKGRDGHVGSFSRRVLQPISNLGNIPPVTVGIGLSFRMNNVAGVALTWVGDGSVKSGPTHEAFNFAAVQRLPVIFIIQNNQIALGTPVAMHHLPGTFEQLHDAYGMAGWSFDGNNVLDAYAATKLAAERCRRGDGPVMLCTETFRMGGHATHDEQEARQVIPPEMFRKWGARDPIAMYEEYLKHEGTGAAELEAVETAIEEAISRAAEEALESRRSSAPVPESAVLEVYAE